MRIRFNSVTASSLLQEQLFVKKIEYAQVRKQIEVLSTFAPDILLKSGGQKSEMFVGVFLSITIAGLSHLTERYNKVGKGGIYRMTATLNTYLGCIIQTVQHFGGDIMKFGSDYLFVMWKVLPSESMEDKLHEAVICALLIQKDLGSFETEVNVPIKLVQHISSGNSMFAIIGDNDCKRYIRVGHSNMNFHNTKLSNSGDVLILPGTWEHMIHERYAFTVMDSGQIRIDKILFKTNQSSDKYECLDKMHGASVLIRIHLKQRDYLHSVKKKETYLSECRERELFIQLLPPRLIVKQAPKLWIVEDLRPFVISVVQVQVDESQPVEYLTEMRMITIQVIKIVFRLEDEFESLDVLEKSFVECNRIITEVVGCVNTVTLNNNKMIILAVYGLRGVDHELESQNALKASFKIKTNLEKFEMIDSVSIGVSKGYTYCGVTGHPLRREYVVIGGALHRAIKYMDSFPHKVSCDMKTFKNSKLASFYFQMISGKNKGWDQMAYVFEYNESFESAIEVVAVSHELIGRDKEYNVIYDIIFDVDNELDYHGICFHGPSMIGKSAILLKFFADLQATNAFLMASICLTESTDAPYFCVSKLYRQLYDHCARHAADDISLILNLPRDLYDIHDDEQPDDDGEDLAQIKYAILKTFRSVICYSGRQVAILVDEIQHIDLQSWEILEIVANERNFRLIAAGTFNQPHWDLKFKISIHEHIKLIELNSLPPDYVPRLICELLNAAGVSLLLSNLILSVCEGRPGLIQCALLSLMNIDAIEMRLINKCDKHTVFYTFPTNGKYDSMDIVPVIHYVDKEQMSAVTLAAISLDLLDSFTQFEQLVIKTSAVLGDLFLRELLVVTLKHPPEDVLCEVIKKLFDEDVFECGSKFLKGKGLEMRRTCCACYYDPDVEEAFQRSFPIYAYCKILHFKNNSIRQVAYELLPDNQRKELHVMCTSVIENMRNICPSCIRDPVNSFIHVAKYIDISDYCQNIERPQTVIIDENESTYLDSIKFCIKAIISRTDLTHSDTRIPGETMNERRLSYSPAFDYKACQCYDVLNKVYSDLIYHSKNADHLTKHIFFMLQKGLVMLCLRDIVNAISILNEARELCFSESGIVDTKISLSFRKLIIGKIEIGLAKANMMLRQYKIAKNHIAIALRQYNIPSVAMSYRQFRLFISRPFLFKAGRFDRQIFKNNLLRFDTAVCFAIAARLFSIEGNWKFTKIACSYSLFIIKSLHPNISLMVDSHTNAIDMYSFSNETQTCIKLQKYAAREIQRNYASNDTFNLFALTTLLSTIFDTCYINSKIISSIRMGFRLLELDMKIYDNINNLNLVLNLNKLLTFRLRFKEAGDIIKLIRVTNYEAKARRALIYYAGILNFLLSTGFYIEPFANVTKFASFYFENRVRLNWDGLYFSTLLTVYYLRLGKYQVADEWRQPCSFNIINIKRYIIFNTLIFYIEARILYLERSIRIHNPTVSVEEKIIKALFKLIKFAVKTHFSTFLPYYYLLKASYCLMSKNRAKVKKCIKKCNQISEKQDNMFEICRVVLFKNYMEGGYVIDNKSRPDVHYCEGETYTLRQYAQFVPIIMFE